MEVSIDAGITCQLHQVAVSCASSLAIGCFETEYDEEEEEAVAALSNLPIIRSRWPETVFYAPALSLSPGYQKKGRKKKLIPKFIFFFSNTKIPTRLEEIIMSLAQQERHIGQQTGTTTTTKPF